MNNPYIDSSSSDSNELMIIPGESKKNEVNERTNAKLTESFKEVKLHDIQHMLQSNSSE
jgi:hypothetical protein